MFLDRNKWAASILSKSREYRDLIATTIEEINVINKGVEIALVHLDNHSHALEKTFNSRAEYCVGLDRNAEKVREQDLILCLNNLNKMKVEDNSLADWIDRNEVVSAYGACELQRASCRKDLQGLAKRVSGIITQGSELGANVKDWTSRTNSASKYGSLKADVVNMELSHQDEILQDIEALVSKVSRDSEHILSLSDTTPNLRNAVRVSSLHEKEFFPQTISGIKDIYENARAWKARKTKYQGNCYEFLQQVSQIQYQTSLLRPQIQKIAATLQETEEFRVTVAQVIDLPYLYGVYMIEQVRRCKWSDIMKSKVSETAEALAGLKQDEERKRSKWTEHYGKTLLKMMPGDDNDNNKDDELPEVEINISSSSALSNTTQRVEKFQDFLTILNDIGMTRIHSNLTQEYETMVRKLAQVEHTPPLDSKNSQQHVRNPSIGRMFKSGSITENALDSSVTASQVQVGPPTVADTTTPTPTAAAGGGGAKATAEAYEKMVKGYESRIRKLESIIHRYEYRQLSYRDSSPSIGSNASSFNHSMSPLPDGVERGRSVSSNNNRPVSGMRQNQLIERITNLESLHASDREKVRQLDEAKDELTRKLLVTQKSQQDAESIKADLLANMSSQESEFSRERRGLLQEISELKLRIEELEEEIEQESKKASQAESKNEHEMSRLKKHLETIQLRQHENNKNYAVELDKFVAKEHEMNVINTRLNAKLERYYIKTRDLSQRLYTSYKRSCELLECMGLQSSKEIDEKNNQVISFKVNRVKGLKRRRSSAKGSNSISTSAAVLVEASNLLDQSSSNNDSQEENGGGEGIDPLVLYWMNSDNEGDTVELTGDENEYEDAVVREDDRYTRFKNEVYIDYDLFRDSVSKRFGDVEHLARKLQREARQYRDRAHRAEQESLYKIAMRSFKEGELALFLPTRDQSRTPNPWAAFNMGAPHYFLKPSEEHKLETREWLVARIKKIEERVVNRSSIKEDDNPFDLSDGLKWHLIEAEEEW